MTPLRMLVCYAHPDDEAFITPGALASSTAQGVEVRLLCATCGEEGDMRQPGLATRATLGQVRYQELRRSCQVLGLQEPVMLGYRDSGWGDSPAQEHPAAFVQAPAMQVIGRIVEEIRRFKPHMVLTFEPEGVSGHKDHKAMCHHATAAVQQAGNPTAFPEQVQQDLTPHTPQRLFYAARLQGFRLQRALALRRAGHDVPLPEPALHSQGIPLEDMHVCLDVSPFLQQMLASMRCHQTQMTPDWAFDQVPWDVTATILGTEYLIQAYPTVPLGTPLAKTFLDGLEDAPELAGEQQSPAIEESLRSLAQGDQDRDNKGTQGGGGCIGEGASFTVP